MFGGNFAPGNGNPTFNPVAKPGAFHQTLKSLAGGELPEGPRYGDLAPLDPAFMYRDHRIECMDEQHLETDVHLPDYRLQLRAPVRRRLAPALRLLSCLQRLGQRRLGVQLPEPDLLPAADPHGRRPSGGRRAGVGHREGRPPRHHDPRSRGTAVPQPTRTSTRSGSESTRRGSAVIFHAYGGVPAGRTRSSIGTSGCSSR